ncbi:hypothetical protein I316_03655 [Kwoniella heveanensis BCC8398]|uniref:COP9 signalosome complex subunit 3 n=1 Tax=Kwoniella heveanensis BCC8398 TaxID=1296120 RepID=A0A1B9GUA3_9TREE|nr:hypothetical protein I316_03655 [Kwoniella heveanensis BCC8398]
MAESSSSATTSHAHPAFPFLPPPPSSRRHTAQIPTKASDILTAISSTDSIGYVQHVLIPSLQPLVDGQPFEGVKLKEKERQRLGEETLACQGEDFYAMPDADVMRMSAGLVYIISARLNSFRTTALYNDELLNFAVRLCSLGDSSQMLLIPKRITNLAWGLLRLAQHLNKVSIAVPALQSLIRLSCQREHFTGVYAAYLEACLISKNFEAGKYVLDQMFLEVRIASPTYLDVLTYFHHAGLICAALRDYGKAQQYFITAVSLPTAAASAIQLACAKRAILCQVLDTGKRVAFPKYTSHNVTRAVDKYAQVYVDLAKEYEAGKSKAVKEIAKKPDFAKDCNQGLVEQVLKSITRRRILQLRETYSRMTINDLVARVGPSSQETVETITAILGEMITSGAISAVITPGTTPATSIVSFTDSRPDYTSAISTNSLAQVNLIASRLEAELAEASRALGASKAYLRKQANILETGGKGLSGAGPGGKGRSVNDFEELMAAEDTAGPTEGAGTRAKGPGSNYADMGF